MEYGETCIPGRMDDLPTILTVADVKLSCDESHGYPNRSFWAFFWAFWIEKVRYRETLTKMGNLWISWLARKPICWKPTHSSCWLCSHISNKSVHGWNSAENCWWLVERHKVQKFLRVCLKMMEWGETVIKHLLLFLSLILDAMLFTFKINIVRESGAGIEGEMCKLSLKMKGWIWTGTESRDSSLNGKNYRKLSTLLTLKVLNFYERLNCGSHLITARILFANVFNGCLLYEICPEFWIKTFRFFNELNPKKNTFVNDRVS